MSIDTPPPPPPPPPPDDVKRDPQGYLDSLQHRDDQPYASADAGPGPVSSPPGGDAPLTPMEKWEAAEDRMMAENIVANRHEAEILRQQGNFEGAQQIEDSIAKLPVSDDIKADPQGYLDSLQDHRERSPDTPGPGTGGGVNDKPPLDRTKPEATDEQDSGGPPPQPYYTPEPGVITPTGNGETLPDNSSPDLLEPNVEMVRPVVIGEQQSRVDYAARMFDAETYPGLTAEEAGLPEGGDELKAARLQHNEDWISQMKEEGRTIIDTGPAEWRVEYPEPTRPSDWPEAPYEAELRVIEDYPNVIRPWADMTGTPNFPWRYDSSYEGYSPPTEPARGGDAAITQADLTPADWQTPTDLPTNSTIDAGRYQFGTDNLGRLVEANGELVLQPGQRQRADAERVREEIVSDFRDQAGHMIGTRFNGPGDNWNMVPQDQNLNQSEWKVMENKWAAALQDGKSVHVHIDLNYDGDDLRPYAFNVEYTIRSPEGEESVQRDILNAPGAASGQDGGRPSSFFDRGVPEPPG
jgi:DNA/RNA non-specific endonuclease